MDMLQLERDPDVLAACVVGTRREVDWELTQLRAAGGRLALYSAAQTGLRLPARLVRNSAAALEVTGSGTPLVKLESVVGQRLIAVGSLRNVKLQFMVEDPEMVGSRDEPTLRCAAPALLHRIQRRSAHRIEFWSIGSARLRLPRQPGSEADAPVEHFCPVVDLSPESIAFLLPATAPAPVVGATLVGAWLESPQWGTLLCGLTVARVTAYSPSGGHRIGCRMSIEPPGDRTLARAMTELQRR